MKTLFYVLAFVTLVGATSCSDEEMITRKEDKVEGSWEFNKAFFKGEFALFRDNVIEDYQGDIIHFHADQTAIYYDHSLDASFEGTWFVNVERVFDGYDDTDREYFLDMEFYDWVNEETFFYYGHIDHLTQNRLNLSIWDDGDEYTFKLACIE